MELYKEDLLLRPLVESDIEMIFNGLSHPEVIRYYGVSTRNMEEAKLQMKWYHEHESAGTGKFWVITDVNDKQFKGVIGIYDIDNTHRKAEIGFWLLPEHQRKGIMHKSINLVCNFAFKQLKLHRIEAFVESEHKHCLRLMEKSSFRFEGCMKDCEIKHDRFISLKIYSLLAE